MQVRGQTSLYLELAAGHATFNLLRMARPGLSLVCGWRCASPAKSAAPSSVRDCTSPPLASHGWCGSPSSRSKGRLLTHYSLVLFEEQESLADAHSATPTADEPASRGAKRERKERRITELEQDMSTLHTEMQTLLEERDAANEVLQIANEEIQASNQELRSLNEELETSKEELQTINEELSTANQELSTRNDQLKAAQEYSEAIVETARSPLVVLSEELRVERANVAFYQFFQTTPPETEGRLLAELGNGQWDIPRLRTLLEQIQPTNHAFHDFEVDLFFPKIGRKTLLLNARHLLFERQPVKEHRILLAMEDVTERRVAEQQVENRLAFLQYLLDALPSSVYLVQGEDARLILANHAALRPVGSPVAHRSTNAGLSGESPDPYFRYTGRSSCACRLCHHACAYLRQNSLSTPGDHLSCRWHNPASAGECGGHRRAGTCWQGWKRRSGIDQTDAAAPAALVVHQDVTSLKEAEELKDRFLGLVAHELRTPLAAIKGFASMLLTQTAHGKGPAAGGVAI